MFTFISVQFSSVQLLSHVWRFATPWITARQASLSITNSWSLLKPTSIKSMMPSSHLILCHPLLLLPSIFPSIRVFSNESALLIKWPKYWSFSLNISPPNEHPGLISYRMDQDRFLKYINIIFTNIFLFYLKLEVVPWPYLPSLHQGGDQRFLEVIDFSFLGKEFKWLRSK